MKTLIWIQTLIWIPPRKLKYLIYLERSAHYNEKHEHVAADVQHAPSAVDHG